MAAGCGARLSEPFLGEIKGSFLVIQGEEAKNGMIREIPLTPEYIETIKEMRRLGWTPKHYSRTFWKACNDAGVQAKYHDLRSTFAVKSWISTKDIYLTAKLMGHANVTTTQIYSQFHLSRLKEDFPSLVNETNRIIPFRNSGLG